MGWRSCWCQVVVLKDVTTFYPASGWQTLGPPQSATSWQEGRCGMPARAQTHHPSSGFRHEFAQTRGLRQQHAAEGSVLMGFKALLCCAGL